MSVPSPNGRRTWCPQWWKHDEAVYRLQALWLSWEYMRVNDGANGPTTWLVNHADARLPCAPPPEDLF